MSVTVLGSPWAAVKVFTREQSAVGTGVAGRAGALFPTNPSCLELAGNFFGFNFPTKMFCVLFFQRVSFDTISVSVPIGHFRNRLVFS